MPELLVTDPSDGAVVGRLLCSNADRLVDVARAAHPTWARTGASDRASALKAGARRLRGAAEEIALLQTREGGKPLGDSRGGVEAGIGAIEQYA
jgi:acyl-CoA reductase-like NAD-dependent aldehyde dehydrogenase